MSEIKKSMWIDGDKCEVSEIGFLIEIYSENTGNVWFKLRDCPVKDRETGEWTALGYDRGQNNLHSLSQGVWKVIKVAGNGRVLLARVLDREELVKFLDDTGFPDLLAECMKPVQSELLSPY
jgi:hypothetical protein